MLPGSDFYFTVHLLASDTADPAAYDDGSGLHRQCFGVTAANAWDESYWKERRQSAVGPTGRAPAHGAPTP